MDVDDSHNLCRTCIIVCTNLDFNCEKQLQSLIFSVLLLFFFFFFHFLISFPCNFSLKEYYKSCKYYEKMSDSIDLLQ